MKKDIKIADVVSCRGASCAPHSLLVVRLAWCDADMNEHTAYTPKDGLAPTGFQLMALGHAVRFDRVLRRWVPVHARRSTLCWAIAADCKVRAEGVRLAVGAGRHSRAGARVR